MRERGFKVSAVLAGLVADLAATLLGGGLLVGVGVVLLLRRGVPFDALESHLLESGPLLVGLLGVGASATALGGTVAARMARHARYRHAVALALVWVVLGALFGETSALPWVDAAGYVLVVPAALLGAYLVSDAPDPLSGAAPSDARSGGLP